MPFPTCVKYFWRETEEAAQWGARPQGALGDLVSTLGPSAIFRSSLHACRFNIFRTISELQKSELLPKPTVWQVIEGDLCQEAPAPTMATTWTGLPDAAGGEWRLQAREFRSCGRAMQQGRPRPVPVRPGGRLFAAGVHSQAGTRFSALLTGPPAVPKTGGEGAQPQPLSPGNQGRSPAGTQHWQNEHPNPKRRAAAGTQAHPCACYGLDYFPFPQKGTSKS